VKGKDGFALVMVIILIAFLAIVSIGLVALWQGAVNQLVQQEESMQAYYLARSGAAALASWIISHPATATSIVNIKSNQIHLKSGSVGTVQVSLIQSGSNLTVVSTGIVNGAKETLKLTLVKAQSGFNFTKAIITNSLKMDNPSTIIGSVEVKNGNLELTGNTIINGNVNMNGNLTMDTNSVINGSVQIQNGTLTLTSSDLINGNVYVKSDVTMYSKTKINGNVETQGNLAIQGPINGYAKVKGNISMNATITQGAEYMMGTYSSWYYNKQPSNITKVSTITFSSFSPFSTIPVIATPTNLPVGQYATKLSNPWNSTWPITISASGYYNNITIPPNDTLNIDTRTGNIVLYVNEFNTNTGYYPKINIIGNNKVILFVTKLDDFYAKVTVNDATPTNPTQFLICSNSTNPMNFGYPYFYGYIYAPNAPVNFYSSVSLIEGGIVSNSGNNSRSGVELTGKNTFIGYEANMPVPLRSGNNGYSLGTWSY